MAYLFGDNWLSQTLYKVLALVMLFVGGLAAYQFVWDLGDVGVGLMTIFNMVALFPLAPKALDALRDYETNRLQPKYRAIKQGGRSPAAAGSPSPFGSYSRSWHAGQAWWRMK